MLPRGDPWADHGIWLSIPTPSPSAGRSTHLPAATWQLCSHWLPRTPSGTSPEGGPLAGDHRGRDAVFEMFGRLVQASEGTFDQRLLDVLTSEEHAVALTHATARRGDHNYEGQDAWIFQVRDGQIAEAWWRPEDVYAADEFWT